MSEHNPELQAPKVPPPQEAIQPHAPDFVETPDIVSSEGDREPLPVWLYLICGFALFLAGSSFEGFGTFGRDLMDQGPGGPIASASTQAPAAPATPMDLGKAVYGQTCANCHQSTGMGQPGTYPPLAASPFVLGPKDHLLAILLKGLQGPVTVNGNTFGTAVMPAQETVLTSEKIANLATFLRASWGNTADAVTPADVDDAKTQFASQKDSWTADQVLKIPPDAKKP
jgi:mono/diheme cytochrome c family protein